MIYRDSIAPSKRRDNALSDKAKKDERPTGVFFAITGQRKDMIHAWLSIIVRSCDYCYLIIAFVHDEVYTFVVYEIQSWDTNDKYIDERRALWLSENYQICFAQPKLHSMKTTQKSNKYES